MRDGLYLKLRAEHRRGKTIIGNVVCFISPTLIADLPVCNSEEVYLSDVLLTQELTDAFSVFAGRTDTLDEDMHAFAHGRARRSSRTWVRVQPDRGRDGALFDAGGRIRLPSRRRADGDGARAQLDGHDRLRHAGLGANALGRMRRDDTFGVGWYWTSASPRIGTLITSQFNPVGDGQGIECFYNYALTPAVRITPDLQYVVPSLRLAEPALSAGVRALVSF